MSTQVKINTRSDFIVARKNLRNRGLNVFLEEMENKGVFIDGKISTNKNYFANVVLQRMNDEDDIFVPNLKVNDDHWDSDDPAWIGKASMSKFHKFMLPKTLDWYTFNILTLGIVPGTEIEAVNLLNYMETQSLKYAYDMEGLLPHEVGLYFHCYPTNSINTLHLHIVDLNNLGPTWQALNYKNLSLTDARTVISSGF